MFQTIIIQVFGHVQGVFFRANTQTMALKLGLTGWVKNREDGSVEIMAQGDRQGLEKLLEWCYHGPSGADVSELEYAWIESEEKFKGFVIIR
ncbi:MAG: acylphosphatase [Candidatus Micrarchaeota archaeon]